MVSGLTLIAVVALAEGPPAPLACLSTWYAVHAQRGPEGRWVAALDDGTVVPWDDGRAKGFEEKLGAPDLEDAFSIPYRTGPIRPVTAQDEDPGRIRVDPLFRATFGHTEEEVRRQLEPVEILGQPLLVHRRARAAF